DGEAGILFRKPPGLCSEPEFEPRDIQQVGSVAAVKNRKTGVEPEIVRVTSQYAIRYRVEGAGPWKAAMVAKLPVRYRIMKRLTHDRFHPPGHLERGATGERQQQDTLGAYTLDDEVRDPMGERHCLAGAGAGNDQKRPGTEGNTG